MSDEVRTDEQRQQDRWVDLYQAHPADWAPHPKKKMVMTPLLVFFGGIFAFAIPTLVGAFFHVMFFHPPVSQEWTPITNQAYEGKQLFVANGCLYCHSGYTRPQDVRQNLYYLYPRVSLPGDFATSDESPNVFGTARIGPDLSQEGGFHPDDWHHAHFSDPRYVDPDSIMPDFSWLSDADMERLTAYVQLRSGKSGLLRYAGEVYGKRLILASQNLSEPPKPSKARKLTLKDVANAAANAPNPPDGNYDGLDFPDPVNLNNVSRTYWTMDNPLPPTKDNLLQGRFIFQERCIGCHGRGGAAVSLAARFMQPTPIDFTSPDDASGGNDTSPGDYYYRVLRGINGSAMENFGTRLRVDDIWKVVLFLKTIPNGGLDKDKLPTSDMYIQWQPPDQFLAYAALHPFTDELNFSGTEITSLTPFEQEFFTVLPGMNATDTFQLPGYGEVSMKAGARDIEKIYQELLDSEYSEFAARKGSTPPVDEKQKKALPDYSEESR